MQRLRYITATIASLASVIGVAGTVDADTETAAPQDARTDTLQYGGSCTLSNAAGSEGGVDVSDGNAASDEAHLFTQCAGFLE